MPEDQYLWNKAMTAILINMVLNMTFRQVRPRTRTESACNVSMICTTQTLRRRVARHWSDYRTPNSVLATVAIRIAAIFLLLSARREFVTIRIDSTGMTSLWDQPYSEISGICGLSCKNLITLLQRVTSMNPLFS